MSANPIPGNDRRVIDVEWKSAMEDRFKAVEDKLAEGAKKFDGLATGQHNMMTELRANTAATTEIAAKLEEHIKAYNAFTPTVQPAVDAITSMQAGVRVIGKFGTGVAKLGSIARKSVVWVTPFIAFGAAVWGYVDGWFTRR